MSSGLYTPQQNSQFPGTQSPGAQSPGCQYPTPQYAPQPQPYAAPSRGGSNWILGLFLVGGGVLLVGSVLVVGAVWYVVSSLEGWMVNLGREGIVAVVEESEIPQGEKKEVIAQVDRVVDAFKKHEIGQDDLERLLTGLDQSPVMTYISYYGMQDYYLENTDLPAAEQEALKLAWRRAIHGVFAGKISMSDFDSALPADDRLEQAMDKSGDEANELLRTWQQRLTKLADEAGVPADPPEVDIGDEAKKLVDELLAK